jgi:Zn-dependent protease with chaperone function
MVFMPSYIVMKFFLNIFESAEKKISRERELHADTIGAGITSKESCAIALVKIYRYDMIFDLMERNLVQACIKAQIPSNIVSWFSHACKELVDTPELRASLNKEQIKHPTDTHPPLLDRLHALHVKLDNVYHEAHTIPSHPAASLFVDREALEEELTTIEAQKVIYQLATAVRG